MITVKVDHLKDISFADPSQNILYDDVLLSLAEEGKLGNTLRIWESPVYFAVLGRTGKVEEDLDLDNLKADRVPVLRRSSGGGTVVQGPGCLNYSFVLSKETTPSLNDLRGSYHIILEGVLTLLSNLAIRPVFRPISDLALENSEKKFSGNAQRRGRNFILHHGTILYDFNLGRISRYLRMPKDIPEYRKGRSHGEFVTNISVAKKDLIAQFKSCYPPVDGQICTEPTFQEQDRLSQFLRLRPCVLKV